MKCMLHHKDYYNKELQDLIELATKDGLVFTNGKFEHEEYILPVMEVLFMRDLTDEYKGNYMIYKRTFQINTNKYEKVCSYAKKHNLKEYLIDEDSLETDEFIEEIIRDVVAGYECFDFDYIADSTGGKIQIQCNEYDCGYGKQEAVDLWFSKEHLDDDFPIGYISFYMMRESDFNEADDNRIDMLLSKYLRFN